MKGINTVVLRGRFLQWIALSVSLISSAIGWADDKVTHVHLLKNMEVSNIARVINIAVRDPDKIRVIAGQGKRLVISDTPDQQDTIAQLLPVLDQPLTETDPDKIQMKMLMNAAQYLRLQKIAAKGPRAPGSASPGAPSKASAPSGTMSVQSYDQSTSSAPYKSIYESDDEKLTKGPRVLTDEPALLSLSNLQLKGIFKASTGSPLALLTGDGVTYTARDGGLFEGNHFRVKNVTSKVLKDRVILMGKDHIPTEFTFKSSL